MHETHSYLEGLPSVNLHASHASNCISFNLVLEFKAKRLYDFSEHKFSGISTSHEM